MIYTSSMKSGPLLFCAACVGLSLHCGDESEPDVDFGDIASDPDYSDFFQAIEEHNLTDALDNQDGQTIFVFKNETFQDALAKYNPTDSEIKRWIGHHLVNEQLTLDQIKRRNALLSANGGEIHVRYRDEGVQLNDDAYVDSLVEDTDRLNAYELDGSLERGLKTKRFEAGNTPDITIASQELREFNVITDFITIEDDGFIHDFQLYLDIEHERLSQLWISLENEDVNATFVVFSGAAPGADFKATLADSGMETVAGGFQRGAVLYPENHYKPGRTFEQMIGFPMAGRWKLTIFDFRQGVDGTLNEWKLIADVGEEAPEPTFIFPSVFQSSDGPLVGKEQNRLTWARGFNESLDITAGRTIGSGDVQSFGANFSGADESPTLYQELDTPNSASFVQNIQGGIEEGAHELEVVARTEAFSRKKVVDVDVVTNDSQGLELLSHVSLPELNAAFMSGSDIWGWTDSVTGAEIAIVTTANGTTFVDVSEPKVPVVLGQLLSHSEVSNWRDAKVYQDTVYIVSEADDHGMQVFDLTQLRTVGAFTEFTETNHVDNFGQAHNIVVNEETGFAYVVGSRNTFCEGGLMMYDLMNPLDPQFIDCFGGAVPAGQSAGPEYPTDVYIHDAQCVIYRGVDAQHQGKELCFTSDETTVGIVDLSARQNPQQLSRFNYPTVGYTHQGWLSVDQSYFMVNDEFDETSDAHNTRTYVFDVRDLDNPSLIGAIDNPRDSVGHNFYVKSKKLFQANYTSGLRILDISRIANAFGEEVAYFDTYPEDDGRDNRSASVSNPVGRSGSTPHQDATFQGAWSNYPYFQSGTIIVSDINRGLFVLREQ